MTPDADAKRRALELLVSQVGAPPSVRLQPTDLAPLAPPLVQDQVGIATTPDEEARLRAEADTATRFADLGAVGSRFIEGTTGARGADIWTPMRERAQDPLKAFLAMEQRKATVRPAAAGKAAKPPPDPNSPDSKRLQAFARSRWPQESPDVISAIVPETFESIRKTLDAKYGIQSREGIVEKQLGSVEERARADREQHGKIWAEKRNLSWANMDLDERELAERIAAREAKAAETERKRQEDRSVPGFETAPGATPTADDAKKMKDTNEAALRMHGNIADLRALHRRYGGAPKGTGAELQQQKLRAIQIEAKNIAGLGALSGPDFSLMQDLSSQDVNSVQSWIQRNFVGASLEQSLEGLEQWMRTTIDATAKARGYAPAPSGPRRVPPSKGLSTGPDGNPTLDDGDMVPMTDPKGQRFRVPAAEAAEAERNGWKRVK